MTSTIAYARARALVERGAFVAFAPGTCDGEPMLAWIAALPDEKATRVAHDPTDAVRAAQAVGVIAELRARARTWGFTPA